MKINTKKLLGYSALSMFLMGHSQVVNAAPSQLVAVKALHPLSGVKSLAWTEWQLTSPRYAGLKTAPFLKFADGRLSVSVGLNSMGGSYMLNGRNIGISNLFSTKMAGPEALMKAETSYSKALQGAKNFEISADGKKLTLRGAQTLTFRLTGVTPSGYKVTETKIVNVAPQLGAAFDGDKTPKYLQLEDLSQGVSWGRFTEPSIVGFNFVPGYRYQLRIAVERNARNGKRRLRLLEVFSQQWMRTAKIEANQKILEVAPTKVRGAGSTKQLYLQVREAGGQWAALTTPVAGFDFREGWRYRLQVVMITANSSTPRYTLIRVLDKMPVTY